jgi:gamma-glutamyltranspeptidase/glutathione hydrolase
MALVQMLNMFDVATGPDFDPDSADGTLLLADIVRAAREDRIRHRMTTGAESMGAAAELIGVDYAATRVRSLRCAAEGSGETSHIVAADGDGNVVSMTQSIERSFGAAERSRLGFLYNGYMRAFKVRNRRHPHFMAPGAPARSNASPSILIRDGGACGAIGSTGSERLASGMFQVLVRLRHEDPYAASAAPRIHATPTGELLYEDRLPVPVLDRLRAAGYELRPFSPYAFNFGGLNLITRSDGGWVGVSEPRRDGTAAGPEDVSGFSG